MKNKKINKLKKLFLSCQWIVKLVYKDQPKLYTIFTVLYLVVAALSFVNARILSSVIDQIILSIQTQSVLWIQSLIIFLTIRTTLSVLQYFKSYVINVLDEKISILFRKIYLKKISSLDYQYFEDKDTLNMIQRTTNHYFSKSKKTIQEINIIIISIINLLIICMIIVPKYWYLAIILIIIQIPRAKILYSRITQKWNFADKHLEEYRQISDINKKLISKKYIEELQINNSTGFLLKKFCNTWSFLINKYIEIDKSLQKRNVIQIIYTSIAIGISVLVLIQDAMNGVITIGLFTFYFSMINKFEKESVRVIRSIILLSENNWYIQEFKKVMELKDKIKQGVVTNNTYKAPKIEFKNVYFKYPKTKKYIFKNFNLIIQPEEEIAIVGANGAGKTTLIKLLLRHYDVEKGQILINGINLKKYSKKNWYKYISFLNQEFNTYQNLSLRDNVRISNVTMNSKEKIIKALKQADIEDIVNTEKGLDEMMSMKYGGIEPSWGQWQKIAIARIFYKDSPILIFDEPTASIDAVSEAKIFNNIYSSNENRTLIIVSHRFSTVRNAQKIIVLDKGEIIEQGSHEELLKNKNMYYKSFNLQAKGYKN